MNVGKVERREDFNSDIAHQYDEYYKGGKKSIYNSRFKKIPVPLREKKMFLRETLKTIKKSNKKHIRILDFGCGDGRFLELFEILYEKIKHKNIQLEIICYDISKIGLLEYEKKLVANNFKGNITRKLEDIQHSKNNHRTLGYISSTFRKDNLQFTFILGYAGDSVNQISKLIGDVDISLCLFGVLSHIPERKERQSIMKLLSTITKYKTIITVPTEGLFKREREAYKLLREQGKAELLGLANEDSDFYYVRWGKDKKKKIENFYHTYSFDEMLEDARISGFYVQKSFISSINHPAKISKNILSSKIDNILSEIITVFKIRYFLKKVNYIGIIAK